VTVRHGDAKVPDQMTTASCNVNSNSNAIATTNKQCVDLLAGEQHDGNKDTIGAAI
jgi:hypothetical protein